MSNSSRSDADCGHGDNGCWLETIMTINCTLNAPLMLVSIVGNALVLAAILRTPSLRSPSTAFLCSLAVSDFLVGLVVQPLLIARVLTPDRSVMHAYHVLSISVGGVSLLTMTAISVDRLLALLYHLRYPEMMTKKRALGAATSIWFIAVALSFIFVWNETIAFFTAFVGIVPCIVVSTFSYVRIYRIVRYHRIQIHVQQQAVKNVNTERSLNVAQSKKSAMNTFIYYICMVICYSPVFVSALKKAIFLTRWKILWTLADTVTFMNSSINPFLYCWRNHEMRQAVLKILRKLLSQQRPPE